MKFAAFIVVCLLIASSDAIRPKKLSQVQQQRIAQIRKGNSWGSILLNLAELHMMSKGPLEELVQAIEDTITDLQAKRVKTEEAYEKRTAEHEALVQQLNNDIANAEQDIADIKSTLEMLAEQKAALEEENTREVSSIAQTKEAISEATRVRELQHNEYLTKVQETEEAVAAVEECLKVLDEFGQQGASFAQIKKAKTTLAEAQKKISKTKSNELVFLNALIQVAVKQEFVDAGALQQVVAKFGEIRQNLYDSSAKLAADEQVNQQTFEKLVADGKESISESEATIEYNNGLLVENAQNTSDNQDLLAQRIADKANFEQELADENTSFDEATATYEAWCTENDREVEVCGEALEVVSTVDFDDYIGDRINAKDGLVTGGMDGAQQHGAGGEVFKFDYDQY